MMEDKLERDEELVETMSTMGTGDCHTEGCSGQYDPWGRCHRCGSVD